jgi:hypothetical protein
MSDQRKEDEAWGERVASVLRETADPRAEARVMERVRAEFGTTAPKGPAWWSWLLRPYAIEVRPVVPIAAVGVLAVVLLFLGLPGATTMPPPGPAAREVGAVTSSARPVQFVCLAVDARQVSVVGDFNDWQPGVAPLERSGSPGVWAGIVWLPPGVYTYALMVDGRLRAADDTRPAAPPDEFGVSNSVLIVDRESI